MLHKTPQAQAKDGIGSGFATCDPLDRRGRTPCAGLPVDPVARPSKRVFVGSAIMFYGLQMLSQVALKTVALRPTLFLLFLEAALRPRHSPNDAVLIASTNPLTNTETNCNNIMGLP